MRDDRQQQDNDDVNQQDGDGGAQGGLVAEGLRPQHQSAAPQASTAHGEQQDPYEAGCGEHVGKTAKELDPMEVFTQFYRQNRDGSEPDEKMMTLVSSYFEKVRAQMTNGEQD